ncbi:MAG: hypothetical protein RMK99_10050 [Anaerolineales bacterium]|nr:hypothetical protein [Anaerolineales bacterium]
MVSSKEEELAAVLERLKNNERVALIRVSISEDACPVCFSLQGAYPKDRAPKLPPDGCSCPLGRSRVFYEPVLVEVYP